MVQIEIVPTGLPISIHCIPASEQHPFVTLFTTGMSSVPMNVPEGEEDYALAEIYVQLPADWKVREYDDPRWGWPQRWLRNMARYPSDNDTWLGGPVSLVANGDPAAPIAPNAKFTAVMLFADQSTSTSDGQTIRLYRMMPLYTEEYQLEIDKGIGALLRAFDKYDISTVVDVNRKNVAQLR